MTSEVVVMNREAIALAADSAVTIGGGPKIFNTANKVFMLAPGYDVGILVFNNAAFMATPWEIIIKAYRDYVVENKIVHADLEEYAIGFFNFIEEHGNEFITSEQEFGVFEGSVSAEFNEIVRKIWNDIKHIFYGKAEITDDEIENVVVQAIEEYHSKWSGFSDIFDKEKDKEFNNRLKDKFNKKLGEIINDTFEKVPLSRKSVNRLKDIGYMWFRKKIRSNNTSGIVFAGYGRDNLYPMCVEYETHCYLCETLIYSKKEGLRIGFDDGNVIAAIMTFAQYDVVHNVLNGRLPQYESELRKLLSDKLDENDVTAILKDVNTEVRKNHTDPIIQTVGDLPKDELATVARTLVGLTSFMRKVSFDLETVGGPVDVAVISKKDGFIWIDRKHYFDIGRNFHYKYNS